MKRTFFSIVALAAAALWFGRSFPRWRESGGRSVENRLHDETALTNQLEERSHKSQVKRAVERLSRLIAAGAGKPWKARLDPPWTGERNHAVRTGHLAKQGQADWDRNLRFDCFHVLEPSSLHGREMVICRSGGGNRITDPHMFRLSLPDNERLAEAATLSVLEETLGMRMGFTDVWEVNGIWRSQAE